MEKKKKKKKPCSKLRACKGKKKGCVLEELPINDIAPLFKMLKAA